MRMESKRNAISHNSGLGRRRFLALGLGTAGAMLAGKAFGASGKRKIHLLNVHTGDEFNGVYWADGLYVPEALAAVNSLMRDHRTGEWCTMDPGLLDTLFSLGQCIGTSCTYHIISGYRSPSTNALLQRKGYGVAKNSLHMEGKAADIHLSGIPLKKLHRLALRLRAGGVGYYPKSNFLHIDTGPVRHWRYPV